jgi:hypothetical protein
VWLHERMLQGDKGRVLLQERFFVVFVPTAIVRGCPEIRFVDASV